MLNKYLEEDFGITEMEEMLYQADRVLLEPSEAALEWDKACEYYEKCKYRAQGVAGYDYAEMGKYGCRITGSGYEDKDAMVEMMAASEKVDAKWKSYDKARGNCLKNIAECLTSGKITDVQSNVLSARYCSGTKGVVGYAEVAQMAGLSDYKQAYYQHQKARDAFALWLHDVKVQENYQRCLANPPQYTSTLYC